MTASAGATTPTSTSMSRVAEAVQVAPYLTHVVRHHGQVTLIPPENTGRIRKGKVKKKLQRPGVARVENSSPSLNDLSAIVAAGPSTSASRSRPQTPRPQTPRQRPRPASSNSFRSPSSRTDGSSSRPGSGVNGVHARSRSYQDDLRIPDFPPPSFEEAMLATPSTRNSTPGSEVERPPSAERTATPSSVRDVPREQPPHPIQANQETSPPSREIEPPSPSSSHSSLEEAAERGRQSIWEDDREAGYSLEERVKRELERRRLAESLPTAPLMRIFEQINGHADQTAVPQMLNITGECTLLKEMDSTSPSTDETSQEIVVPSRSSQERRDSPAAVPSTSSDSVGNEGQSPGIVAEESSSQRIPSRKGKEREVVPDEPIVGNELSDSYPSDQPQGSTLSRIRDVLNSPLWPQQQNSNPITDSVSVSPRASSICVEREPPDLPPPHQHLSSQPIVSNSTDDPSNTHALTTPAPSSPFQSDVSNHVSITPSSLSSSVSPSDSLNPQPPHSSRPLPIPPGPSPSISAPDPLPARRAPPPVLRPGTSVRERVSAFESLTNRPVPPPPPVRMVIRRPPPPVPGPLDISGAQGGVAIQTRQQRGSIGTESDGTIVAEQQQDVNAPCLPHRRRPPPVPTHRRKEIDGVKPDVFTLGRRTSDTKVETEIPSSSSTSRPESTVVASNILEATDLVCGRDTHDQNERLLGLTTLVATVNETVPLGCNAPTSVSSLLSDTQTNLTSESQTEALPLGDMRSENQSQINISVDGAGHSPSSSVTESQGDPHTSTRTVETIDDVVGRESLHASVLLTENPPSIDVEQLPVDTNLASTEVTGGDSTSSSRAEDPPSIIPPMQPLQPMFTGLTDLDLLLARLDDPDFTFSGRSYDDLLLLEEIMGPATATGQLTHPHTDFDDIPMGKVEVLRRRVTKDGRTKLKLALLGVVVDKCGICLVQFKESVFACLLPCRHAFHDNCLRLWMRRGETCPMCRGPLCYS
ncbi:uncharacterized protein FOMMEDRAFT_171216 [Fomitiporia mediterranea MF3/22]|uniref:uncharacterized protein n=1 Tax=Fomitiporia mediterranea (strain MF3/22) TaxID=694068 RepID=UPI0004407ADB|nr:uncharacterized protein FOMMEDRAFT_171216 [Fomitiporia mediterranea MF3/22]EJC98314.1 hypothetical protein FOMMEDRAFT_171216 [Fomitiporia mediterranea MF3/22]